jgi:beta-phosphoglucomutase-like phosphatase (HAD superfamily)
VLGAIVFDFDGVIANSEPLHFRAYRDVLLPRGVTLGESDYYGRYLGYDDYGAFAAIGRDHRCEWSNAQIDELIALKAARMIVLEQDASVLFPGAADAVRAAASAVPIAIASGALGSEIRRVLDHAQLTRYFAAIVAAEDTPVSKPAPDPYLKAVALITSVIGPIDAGSCVAIEDSHWGLQSARTAGLKTVGVAQTYPAESLAPADLVIPSMTAFDLDALRSLF